jgi:hypothetical protein
LADQAIVDSPCAHLLLAGRTRSVPPLFLKQPWITPSRPTIVFTAANDVPPSATNSASSAT